MTLPHLDDEELSAHLDGEGDAGAAVHIGSCPLCEERLASFVAVASAVGTAVGDAPSGRQEAALLAARAAWADGRAGAAEGTHGGISNLTSRRRLPRWALPIAAAAAALLVAVPVLSSLGDRDPADTAATLADRRSEAAGQTEVAGIDGGDLGEQSDQAELARAIIPALPGAATEAALAARPPAGAGDMAGPGEPEQPTASAPAPAAAQRTADEGETKAANPVVDPPCARTGRTTYGTGLGPLVYSALVRWQGTPAVVLAYRLADPGAPGLDYRVLVMARKDCRLLVAQSL